MAGAFSFVFSSAATVGGGWLAPMQAQAALLAGAAVRFDAVGLWIGDQRPIGLSGKPMNYRSEETALRWAELLAVRAASEAGLMQNLPDFARAVWLPRKVESLRAYADRVWTKAASWPEGAPERAALIDEASAAEARAASLEEG